MNGCAVLVGPHVLPPSWQDGGDVLPQHRPRGTTPFLAIACEAAPKADERVDIDKGRSLANVFANHFIAVEHDTLHDDDIPFTRVDGFVASHRVGDEAVRGPFDALTSLDHLEVFTEQLQVERPGVVEVPFLALRFSEPREVQVVIVHLEDDHPKTKLGQQADKKFHVRAFAAARGTGDAEKNSFLHGNFPLLKKADPSQGLLFYFGMS